MSLHGKKDEMPEELGNAYAAWMTLHAKESKGDAQRRLANHGHAERMFLSQVWWPAFGTLEGLHPEYEVRDFKDGWRYLDFAYLSQGFKVGIEIDGYGPHWRDADRWRFADQLMRQNQLIIDGWLVLRFSYDDIMEKPRRCQQAVQQLLGKISMGGSAQKLTPLERSIVAVARRQVEPIGAKFIAEALGVNRHTAHRHLRSLAAKGILLPVRPDAKHIWGYKLCASVDNWGL